MSSDKTVNELMVSLFNDIIELEEKILKADEFKDISKNDMHIIDAIGIHEVKNMSTLAKKLRVTVGTLTTTINNLVKKGYVERTRSKKDKRVVLVSLNEKGERAFERHEAFHKEMINSVLVGLEDKEVDDLITMLSKIRNFIDDYNR